MDADIGRGARAFAIGCLVWAALGAIVAIGSLGIVNADAKVLVGVAGVVFPLCAVGAAMLAVRGHWRLAGLLLALSAGTPTYFIWVPNAVALVIGVVLLVGRHPRSVEAADGPIDAVVTATS